MKKIEPKPTAQIEREPVGQFIDCRSGEITNAYFIQDDWFYGAHELRKDGKPSGRCKGRPCQIRVYRPTHGTPWFVGRYAPVLPEREAVTEPMRRRILEIRQQADHLERQMLEIYAGERLNVIPEPEELGPTPEPEQNTHCCYCGQDLGRVLDPDSDTAPDVNDDTGWILESFRHLDECEWVRTRAHRLPKQEFTPVEYEVRCLPEDETPESCYPDDTPEVLRWIHEQLAAGNEWAWCCVEVTAKTTDQHGKEYVGRAYLAGCSYASREDFCKPGGYFDDLKQEALDHLIKITQHPNLPAN